MRYAEGSWMDKEIKEQMRMYFYHEQQMKNHEEAMKNIIDDVKSSIEGYKKEYREISEFIKEHPERNQRMREFGHRMPIVENIK